MKDRSLRDLFHLVRQVIPEEQELITITPETSAGNALEQMKAANISQLPVIEGKAVLGAFSYRSFADGIQRLPEKESDILSLPVEEFLDDLHFATLSKELAALLSEFDLKDAVFVGTEDRLLGIITSVDALNYFYEVASPYVLLREIELAVRELIRDSVDEERIKECIDRSLHKKYGTPAKNNPESVEDLTLNDYVTILRYQGTWDYFKGAFGGTSRTAYARLKDIPDLRNDVFHFRRELNLEEYDNLRGCRDWLLKRIRKVEEGRKGRNDG